MSFEAFKHSLARRILAHPGFLAHEDNADDALDDFTTYLAQEIWPDLPPALRNASPATRDTLPDLDELPLSDSIIPPSFSDTLFSCGLADPADPDAPAV